jgi:hypothetical protein
MTDTFTKQAFRQAATKDGFSFRRKNPVIGLARTAALSMAVLWAADALCSLEIADAR